ncbi:MAG: hypothetical protein ABI742_01290 [Gemmatimonadota bacterium]
MRIPRALLAVAVVVAAAEACADGNGPGGKETLTLNTIVAAGNKSCGLTEGGTLLCWGMPLNQYVCDDPGQSGPACVRRPMVVADSSRLLLHGLIAGGFYGGFCGLDPLGDPWCLGSLLVDIDGIYSFPDTLGMLASGLTISSLAMGTGHICGLGPGGNVYCWGDHDGARRGDYGPYFGTGTDFVPNQVSGGGGYTALAATYSATCGVQQPSQYILCWGYDSLLGHPAIVGDSNPDHCGFFAPCGMNPSATGGFHQYSAVVSGRAHSCGLEAAGAVYCWGFNFSGQVGTGDTSFAAAPVAIPLPHAATALFAGPAQSCARLSSGELYCWGDNTSGVFGSGPVQFVSPTHMAQLEQLVSLSFGDGHACGLTMAGVAYCWGANDSGQLGTGDAVPHDRPFSVARPIASS